MPEHNNMRTRHPAATVAWTFASESKYTKYYLHIYIYLYMLLFVVNIYLCFAFRAQLF